MPPMDARTGIAPGQPITLDNLDIPETASPKPFPEPARKRGPAIILGLAAGLIFGILFTAGLAHFAVSAGTGLLHSLSALLTGRSTAIDTSSPAIVDRIRKLSRLETVIYSIDKIVEGERQYALLPNFLTGDKLLLIGHGEVIAGVDLSQLKASDVSISGDPLHGGSIHIHLPAAQVLTTRLDNNRTKVYSRMTGVLVTADPNLETQVRQAAEQQITQAAIADGILDRARQNARASVAALLSGLGFHSVTIT
jgi:Protein of unknown function (DUF4230)